MHLAAIRVQVSFGLEFQDCDEIGCIYERFVFGIFFFAHHTFIGSLGEDIDADLDCGINAKFGHS